VIKKSKLAVYYEVTLSVLTVAVFKCPPAFTWPSAWPIVISRQWCIWSQI